MRTILHIDMDAFFASAEQRDNPRLRNKPIAVVGSNSRFVLVSPSYEARAFGVKTGMTGPEARALCPEIILVKANTEKYTKACSSIIKLLYQYTPDIEVYSIDEFFLDITNTMHLFGEPESVAEQIQRKVADSTHLSCSLGIAHNKLLAKFASEKRKPGGIFTIRKEDLPDILNDVICDELWGIGKKTKEALERIGIKTLGELAGCNALLLKRKFGINGLKLNLMARGIDDSPVIPMGCEEEAKSIGHSMTFSEDTSDPAKLRSYMLELSDKVGRRLRKASLCAKNIKLTIRYKSFKTFTRQISLDSPSDDTKYLYQNAIIILKSIRLTEPVRLMGITAGKLTSAVAGDFLFDESKRKYKLNRLLDHVNERFGEKAVSFASLLSPQKYQRVISPAWRPYGRRQY